MEEIQHDSEATRQNVITFASLSAQLAALGVHHTANAVRK